MSIRTQGLAILGLLSQHQGQYASGPALVHATGSDVDVPHGTVGLPILNGELDEQAAVRVAKNPATDGEWTVTSAGVAVTLESVVAGTRVNLAAGTSIRWDPPLAGVEATSDVQAPGLTGGTQLSGFGTLRQLRLYRDLGTKPTAEDFFRAQVDEYPAAVLAWEATIPHDGPTGPGLGRSRLGGGKRLVKRDWRLFIVTSRLDAEHRRRSESYDLVDELLQTLTEEVADRGIAISRPDGIEIVDAREIVSGREVYVDQIRFATSATLSRRASTETFNDWLTTRMRQQTEPQAPDPPIDLPDHTVDMRP